MKDGTCFTKVKGLSKDMSYHVLESLLYKNTVVILEHEKLRKINTLHINPTSYGVRVT